jgi:predicted metal-dependent enzyme (double-stranded beta helix superfamily)
MSFAVVPSLSRGALTELVRQTASDEASWRPRLEFPAGTDRWWTRLLNDPAVDVWLLSWLPGQTTELHDHGSSAAAFNVVEGELDEVRIGTDGASAHHRRPRGSLTWLAPGLLHDVSGGGDGLSVSIHAYSPPLTQMTYYERTNTGVRVLRSVETHEPEEELAR